MKNYDDHLKEALIAAELTELPNKCEGAWKGRAIIKVTKVGGREMYCIGTWNEKAKTANIAMDFDTLMQESFVEAYPIPDKKKDAQTALIKAKEAEMRNKIEAEYKLKFELAELGVKDAEGTVEELKAQILAIKNEKGEVELDEMRKFLIEIGYDETYCNRLTLEAAKASVTKIKGLHEEIKALGGEPKGNAKELAAQLKELKK